MLFLLLICSGLILISLFLNCYFVCFNFVLVFKLFFFKTNWKSGFSKRIEVGVSIYKVGELSAGGTNRAPQAQVVESQRGGLNFEILDCRRCILSIFCHWILLKCVVLWKAFFCKIYYNVVSVAAGEKQGYTKQFSRRFSWQNQPQNISSARKIEKCCNI